MLQTQGQASNDSIKFIPLRNFKNSEYIGNISIGTPPQQIPVLYDTGSGNLLINSKLCKDEPCERFPQYDQALSSTVEEIGQSSHVQFGTGSIDSKLSRETIKIKDIELKHQAFG